MPSSIPFYMTAETSRRLILAGREIQAKITHRNAVRAERARLNRRDGRDRRIFAVPTDMLNGADRRFRERRFDDLVVAPAWMIDVILP